MLRCPNFLRNIINEAYIPALHDTPALQNERVTDNRYIIASSVTEGREADARCRQSNGKNTLLNSFPAGHL